MRNLSLRAKLGIWIGGPIGLLIIIVVLAGIFAPTPRQASASGDLKSSSAGSATTTSSATILSAPSTTSSPTAVATSTPQTVAPTHTPSPTHTTAPKPKPKPSPSPTHKAVSLCGAPSNPWGFNFCGRGHSIRPSALPDAVCSYFNCIPSFYDGNGYMVECHDGTYSMSGGIQGACSHHSGVWREVYSG